MSTRETNLTRWFINSPASGIRRIGRAKTFITSLFWGYCFWIFFILMICFTKIVISNYRIQPTKIHLTIQSEQDPQFFPAITFCNIVPLRDDGFLNTGKKTPSPNSNTSTSSTDDEQNYLKAVNVYMERILGDQVSGQKHPFVKWGFQLDDILITCLFNKRKCNRKLRQMFHPNYGFCYTFDNDLHVRKEIINDTRPDWFLNNNDNGDEKYQVFFEFYLQQKTYNQYLDNRAAMRIFIHRKHEIPILSQTSLFIGPDRYTKITFLPRVMSFMQQCRQDLTEHMKYIFSNQQIRYTQALCYKICEHQYIVRECECIDPRFVVFYQYFNNNKHQTSNISVCPIDCYCLRTHAIFNSTELCSECLPECEIIQYSVQSSYASYPNIQAKDKVYYRVKEHFHNRQKYLADLNSTDVYPSGPLSTGLDDNIVALEISASAHATEILRESPVYTWVDLISSIGGQTSLWIGVSIISVVEILELIYLLIYRFCIHPYFWK